MKLSLIIPTKDRQEVFSQTLQHAVNAVDDLDAEIIIVNDSKDSQPIIPLHYTKVRLINNPKSGVAAARNVGVQNSTGDLLLFLDNDILVSRESIDHILLLHGDFKDACFNLNWEYPVEMQARLITSQFGRFIKKSGLTSFKGWYGNPEWIDHKLFASRSVASFHLSISRSNFAKTKGYNEQFPHAGFEDYDFPLQLKEAGLKFYIDSRITVFHNEADRMSLNNWLSNQERRAGTRRVAVNLGYKELTLKFSFVKRTILSTVVFLAPLIMIVLRIIPNVKWLDPLYGGILGTLQAGTIYKGYQSIKNK